MLTANPNNDYLQGLPKWMNNIRPMVFLFIPIIVHYINIYLDKKTDSKYRRYVAALEKCLQSFESVNEWADVISFLSRLGKVKFIIRAC